MAATENAQQPDESWLNFSRIWLLVCCTSFESLGIVFIDGHSSLITREFIELAAQYGLYVVIEPSHMRKLLQVGDVGMKRFL